MALIECDALLFDLDGVLIDSTLLNSLPAETWAIATSGTRDVATARLHHAGLPIPRVLVTGDDVTNGKPDPEPYLAAAKGLGIPADRCVVIEDSPAGIEAACSAGMQTVAIATTHPYRDLGKANVIARRLSDIHIENGSSCRLAVRIEGQ